MKNLFAYTEPGIDYPGYISINERDGVHTISVRSAGKSGQEFAEIVVTPELLESLATSLIYKLNGEDAPVTQPIVFDFGWALTQLKRGCKVARKGWNGKGLFIYLVPAASYPAQTGVAREYFGQDARVPYAAYIALKNVDETVSTWAPSINDALAEDWVIA